MKKNILFITICLSVNSCSLDNKNSCDINDFFGIPWGSSKEYAKEMMLNGWDMKFLPNESNDTILYFDGGKYFGIQTNFYDIKFANNNLYGGSINFSPELNGEIMPTYLKLKKNLVKKYGEPDIEKESVDPSKNNMDDLKNLKKGIGQMYITWYFSVPKSKWKNWIVLILITGSDISVMYTNGRIFRNYF